MNTLLLAEELRATIMRDSLGLSEQILEDYTWEPLDYTTILDEPDVKPVTKIDELNKEQLFFTFAAKIFLKLNISI